MYVRACVRACVLACVCVWVVVEVVLVLVLVLVVVVVVRRTASTNSPEEKGLKLQIIRGSPLKTVVFCRVPSSALLVLRVVFEFFFLR